MPTLYKLVLLILMGALILIAAEVEALEIDSVEIDSPDSFILARSEGEELVYLGKRKILSFTSLKDNNAIFINEELKASLKKNEVLRSLILPGDTIRFSEGMDFSRGSLGFADTDFIGADFRYFYDELEATNFYIVGLADTEFEIYLNGNLLFKFTSKAMDLVTFSLRKGGKYNIVFSDSMGVVGVGPELNESNYLFPSF